MGIDDRDYMRNRGNNDNYYNPKEFRNMQPHHPKKRVSTLGKWLILAFVGSLAVNAFQNNHSNFRPQLISALGRYNSCEQLPPNGSGFLMEPSIMRRSDVFYSGIQIDNLLTNPAVFLISNTEKTIRYEAVIVYPRQSANVSLPISDFGLSIMTGVKWCNLDTGFFNGTNSHVNGIIPIKSGNTTKISLEADTAQLSGIFVKYTLLPLAPPSIVNCYVNSHQ